MKSAPKSPLRSKKQAVDFAKGVHRPWWMGLNSALLAVSALAALPAAAEEFDLKSGGNWYDAGIWKSGKVPGTMASASDSVTIQAGTSKISLSVNADPDDFDPQSYTLSSMRVKGTAGASGVVELVGDYILSLSLKSLDAADGATIVFDEGTVLIANSLTLNGQDGNGRIEIHGSLYDPTTVDGTVTVKGGTVVFNNMTPVAGATTLDSGKIVVAQGVFGMNGGLVLNGGTLTADPLVSGSTGRTVSESVSLRNNVQLGETGADTLDLAGEVDLGGARRVVTVVGSNTISGTVVDGGNTKGTLVKSGPGTLVLSGFNNSYSGGTELSEGILHAAGENVLGGGEDANGNSLPGGQLVVGAGTLRLGANQTISSVLIKGGVIEVDPSVEGRLIVNGGGITAEVADSATISAVLAEDPSATPAALLKTGAGTLRLNGQNEYSGGTTLSSGVLIVGSDKALGTGTVQLSGGALASDGSGRVLANAVVLAGSVRLGGAGSGSLTIAGKVSLQGNAAVLDVATDTVFSGGVIDGTAGAGRLIKEGAARLTLSGPNSSTGGTELRSGMVVSATDGALGGGSVTVHSGTLDVGTTRQNVSALSIKSGAVTGGQGGRIVVVNGGSIAADVAESAAIHAVLAEETSGAPAALVKTGAGTLSLTGQNEYSGGTTLSSGVLIVGSEKALGTGVVQLSGGSLVADSTGRVLANAAVIAGSVNLGGAGSGPLTIAGSVSLQANAAVLDVATDTVFAGGIKDGTAGAGLLIKEGAAQLTLSGANSSTGGTELRSGKIVVATDDALGRGSVTVQGGTLHGAAPRQTVSGLSIKSGVVSTDLGGRFVIKNSADSFVQAHVAHSATISAAIADEDGKAGVRKTGAGELYLSGANSYTGDTRIEEGRVRIESGDNGLTSGPLGAPGTGAVVIAGGDLVVTGTGAGSTVSINKEVRVVSSGQLLAEQASLTVAKLNVAQQGTVRVNGDVTATVADISGTVTLSGDSPLRAQTLSVGSGAAFVWDKPNLTGGQGLVITGSATTDLRPATVQFSNAFMAKALAETGSLNSASLYSGTLVVGKFATSNGTVSAPESVVQPQGILRFKLVSTNGQKDIDLVLERRSLQQFVPSAGGSGFGRIVDNLPELFDALVGVDPRNVQEIVRKADGGSTFANLATVAPAQALAVSASVDVHLDNLSAIGGAPSFSLGVRVEDPSKSTPPMTSPASGEEDRQWMAWTAGYGSWAQTDPDASGGGKSTTSGGGGSIGLERRVGDFMGGFVVSIGESLTRGYYPSYMRMKSDSWNLGSYGSINIGAITLDASALWGTSEQESRRTGPLGVLTARYGTQNWQTGIGVAANLIPKESSWQVSPVARLKYINSSEDGFSETGSALNLGASAHNNSHVLSKLGLRVAKSGQLTPSTLFGLDAAAYWVHDYNSEGRDLQFTLGNNTYTSRTRDRQADSVQFNLGMQATFSEQVMLRLSGQQDLSEDRRQTTGLFTVGYKF